MDRKGLLLALAGAAMCLSATMALSSETITYSYDARGRLTKVTRTGTAAGNIDASYTYDPADNRTNVTVGEFQVLTGTSQNNVIQGGAGNDQISGLGGDDQLYGNDGADYLDGGTHNDTLYGGNGNDTLVGGDNSDVLDGGPGADTMIGGNGHDDYVVDNAGDVVTEAGGGGTDKVESWIDYILPTHVEQLYLAGTATLEGRGNTGANLIVGNGAGNFLNGGAGDDDLRGGGGGDRLYGSEGDDVLRGESGDDLFFFNTAPGVGNVDTIMDYSVADDTIRIAKYAYTAMGPTGNLASTKFASGTAATSSETRIIYDGATGNLWYDPDGTGSSPAILFARVTAGTGLTHAEFIVYN